MRLELECLAVADTLGLPHVGTDATERDWCRHISNYLGGAF